MDAGESVTVSDNNGILHQVVVLQEENPATIKNSTSSEGGNNIGDLKEVVNHVSTVVEKQKNDKTAIDGVEKFEERCEKVEEKDGADGNIVATGEDENKISNTVTTDDKGQKINKTATDVVYKFVGNSKEVEGVNEKNANLDPTEEAKDDNSNEVLEVEECEEVEELAAEGMLEEGKYGKNATHIKEKGETVHGDNIEKDVKVCSEKKSDEKNTIQVKKGKESVVAVGMKIDEKAVGICRKKNDNKGTKTGNKLTPKANPKTPESGKKRKVSDKPSSKDEDKQEPSSLKRTALEKTVKIGSDVASSNKENEPKEKGDAKDELDPLVKNMATNQSGITKNEPGSSLRKKGKKQMDEARDGTGSSVNKNVPKGKEKTEDTPGSSRKKKTSEGKFAVDEKAGSSRKKKRPKKRAADGMGMIFMCSSKTKKDCYEYKVLGMPAAKKDIVQKIYKGMRLFLFDVDLRVMYGIYRAAGRGGFNIEPKAFMSAFPSQVRFKILHDRMPLEEEKFKKVIKDNYYSKNKFNGQLNSEQVKNLCKLFHANSRNSRSESARDLKPERNRVRGDQGRRNRSHHVPAEEIRGGPAVRLNHHQRRYEENPAVYPAVYERAAYMPPPSPPVAQYPPPALYRQDRAIEEGGYSSRRLESYLPYNRPEVALPMYHHHNNHHPYSAVNEPTRIQEVTYPMYRGLSPPPLPARRSYEEEYRGIGRVPPAVPSYEEEYRRVDGGRVPPAVPSYEEEYRGVGGGRGPPAVPSYEEEYRRVGGGRVPPAAPSYEEEYRRVGGGVPAVSSYEYSGHHHPDYYGGQSRLHRL